MEIILFRGRPGVGKSTLSKAFAKEKGLVLLSKDDLYDPLANRIADHSVKNVLSYQLLYQLLEANLSTDVCLALDFPFQNDEDLAMIEAWSKKHKISLKSVLVTCSDEYVWAERFNQRAENPKPNQLITDFVELKKHYKDVMQLLPKKGELVVDSSDPLEDMLKVVKNSLA